MPKKQPIRKELTKAQKLELAKVIKQIDTSQIRDRLSEIEMSIKGLKSGFYDSVLKMQSGVLKSNLDHIFEANSQLGQLAKLNIENIKEGGTRVAFTIPG